LYLYNLFNSDKVNKFIKTWIKKNNSINQPQITRLKYTTDEQISTVMGNKFKLKSH
jgi:hypothetical protein